MKHTIRIHASAEPGKFDVTGAVQIESTGAPIIDAAHELLARHGADGHDTLHATGDCLFSPMPLHRLTAPRRRPLRSDIEHQQAFGR